MAQSGCVEADRRAPAGAGRFHRVNLLAVVLPQANMKEADRGICFVYVSVILEGLK
jgi:hypothetical protein